MGALTGGRLQHAGAQPLAAHLHQAEGGDAADLDAGAIVLQRLLHRLSRPSGRWTVVHVDEVDDDEARHVAQPQLARDLLRRFEIGGVAVCSILCSRVERPELMSIETSASVGLMTR
jgi:L-rhamnose isomerase